MSRRIRWVSAMLLASGAFLLPGCGGGGDGGAPIRIGAVPPPPAGAGAGTALAIDSLVRTGPVPAEAADWSGALLLTRLEVMLTGTASVAELDAAMAAVGATGIGMSRPGSPYLTLIVPRQADGAALAALAQQLQGMPGILFAAPGRQMSPLFLPGEEADTAHSSDLLGHLLPARFPAAWNTALAMTGDFLATTEGCLGAYRATVILVDFFQTQPSPEQIDAFNYHPTTDYGAHLEGSDLHGARVAATLAAEFDDVLPTGALALPRCVEFVRVDATGLSYWGILDLVHEAIDDRPASNHLILNESLGFSKAICGPNGDQVCHPDDFLLTPTTVFETEVAYRITAAIHWAELTSAARDERLLLVQAAGNEAAYLDENGGLGLVYPGIRQADLVSPLALATQLNRLDELFSAESELANELWTSPPQPSMLPDAALLQQLKDELLLSVTRIPDGANLLLVGSTTPGATAQQVTASEFSNEGAEVFAVGERVVTLDGHLVDGTSFAAPQVAGLAAYLWMISELDARPASETVDLIRNTTAPNGLIDAYAATLALDVVLAETDPGIREALLDVTGDGRFDEQDLFRFSEAYGLDDPGTPTIPEERDYSRFDLNGDGATGGIPVMPFDLDRSGPPGAAGLNSVDREVEGYPITFNEARLSDIQILCYYAYSELFAAPGGPSPAQEEVRTELLGPAHCAGVRMDLAFPATITGSTPIDITMEQPDGNGSFVPAANLRLDLTSQCSQLGAATGQTDAEGRFSTTVTADEGCSTVSVTATARAEAGSQPLAQQTITAAVDTGATVVSLSINVGGPTPGMIRAWLFRSDHSDSFLSGPISDLDTVMAEVSAALAGTSELSTGLRIDLYENVSLSFHPGIPVGYVELSGQTTAACAATLSVTVGEVRRGQGEFTGTGNAGVSGCLGSTTLTMGDVGDALYVRGTHDDIVVTAGTVGRGVIIGSNLTSTSSLSATVSTQAYGALGIGNTQDSSVSILGTLVRQPSQLTAGLGIEGNTNLTLQSVTAGELNDFDIVDTSFTQSPSITVGNVVHPGGGISLPDGSVLIQDNTGLRLATLSMGDVEGSLRIVDNTGFSNEDAADFAEARTVGGATAISGNSP